MTRSFKSEKLQLQKVTDWKKRHLKLKCKAIPHNSHCRSYFTNATLWAKVCCQILQSRPGSAVVNAEFWELCPSPWDNTHSSRHLQPCESAPLPALVIPTGVTPAPGESKSFFCTWRRCCPLSVPVAAPPQHHLSGSRGARKLKEVPQASQGRAGRRWEHQFQPGSCSAQELNC